MPGDPEESLMSDAVKQKSAPAPEPVTVTVTPVHGAGAGVYEVTVKVDDRALGSSVVRTSPREFAFQ